MPEVWEADTAMQDRDTVKGLLPCPLCGGEVTLWNYEFGTIKVFECKACRTRFIFPFDKDVSNGIAGQNKKRQQCGYMTVLTMRWNNEMSKM